MSESLGFIHHWLYKKIRLVLEREVMIIRASNDRFDQFGDELEATLNALYGTPLGSEVRLEDVIDHNNIHGWLQKQVTTVEIREATLIKDLIDCYGEEAIELIVDAFKNHGFQCGMQAKNNDLINFEAKERKIDAPGIYQLMQNYMLNGMPCDKNDSILKNDPQNYIWLGNHRSQRLVWTKTGVSTTLMTKLYRYWIEEFILGLDLSTELKVDERVEPFTYNLSYIK